MFIKGVDAKEMNAGKSCRHYRVQAYDSVHKNCEAGMVEDRSHR